MSISSAVSELFNSTKNDVLKGDLNHGTFSSTRLWVLMGFAAVLLTPRLVTEFQVWVLFWLALAYIVTNTVTKSLQMILNARMRSKIIDKVYADGKLSETEALTLKSAP
jgi:hypothetical protein